MELADESSVKRLSINVKTCLTVKYDLTDAALSKPFLVSY